MAGILRVPRSRGALSGLLLVLLGAWGGLVPFVGPYFGFGYTPGNAWHYTTGRLWLEILPAAAAVLGGLILLVAAYRPVALFGATLSAVAGAWFVVGSILLPLWVAGSAATAGAPSGGPVHQVAEQIGFFPGVGAAIVFFAALALGRLSAVTVRDSTYAETRTRALVNESVAADTATVPSPRQPV